MLYKILFLLVVMVKVADSYIAPGSAERLSQELKQDILDIHNEIRRNQSASNMRLMEWSNALEEVAYDLAFLCGHRSDPIMREEMLNLGYFTGEITYHITGKEALEDPFDVFTRRWQTKKKGVIKFAGPHFRQAIWWSTYQVGCALRTNTSFISCANVHNDPFFYVRCIYAPIGHLRKTGIGIMPNQRKNYAAYIKGNECSNCGEGEPFSQVDHRWTHCLCGLCTRQELPDDECDPDVPIAHVQAVSSTSYLRPMSSTLVTLCLLTFAVYW